jgi:protein transport protein SEC24
MCRFPRRHIKLLSFTYKGVHDDTHAFPTNPHTPSNTAPLTMAERKKKDRYAGVAGYEFGANSQGQQPAYGGPPAPGYGAAAPVAPAYGASSPGGYGAPAPAYGAPQPAPGYGAPAQDPNALSQQFGQMNMGPPQGQAPQFQPQQPSAATVQNQLFPSDLIAQPFHVSELYNPPPPIHLPANAAATPSEFANDSSKYLRCTLNAMPTSHSLLKKSKLPFALIISPYASLHDSEDTVPVVHDQVISRCRRCRGYINPYVTFLDHGHRWRCNMCNLTNDVPQAFDWDAAQQKSVRSLEQFYLKDPCLLSLGDLELLEEFDVNALGLAELRVC